MQFRPIEAFFAVLILYVILFFANPFFAIMCAIIFGTSTRPH